MEDQNSGLTVSTTDGATVVEMTHRKILDEINISRIGERLNAIVAESDTPKLVLDFENVSHMSSSALGMLITVHKHVREKDGSLWLCNIQPSIYEVFVITRLNEIFQIAKSRQEALEQLA